MAFTMKDQAAAANRIMERLERQPKKNPAMNPRGARVDVEYQKFSKFKKANPSSFHGTFTPDRADEWVKAIEKIFSALPCTDQ